MPKVTKSKRIGREHQFIAPGQNHRALLRPPPADDCAGRRCAPGSRADPGIDFFQAVGRTRPGRAGIDALPGNRARWRQVFRLEPLQPEKTELPINPLRFRQGKDPTWIEQPWKPIVIQVTTEVTAPALNEARDITPIRTLPEPPGWRPWLIGGGAGLGALVFVLLGFGAWRRARREIPEPPLAPHEWAIRELECLEGMALPASPRGRALPHAPLRRLTALFRTPVRLARTRTDHA